MIRLSQRDMQNARKNLLITAGKEPPRYASINIAYFSDHAALKLDNKTKVFASRRRKPLPQAPELAASKKIEWVELQLKGILLIRRWNP